MDMGGRPFYLDSEEQRWVKATLAAMSREDKVAQMFCLTGDFSDPVSQAAFVEKVQPGAWMSRAGDAVDIRARHQAMQAVAKVPLLIAANLESGGNGIDMNGTHFAKPLQVAASGNRLYAERLGRVCAIEGAALGCNLSFGPVVDIDMNWRNPITNVRTFGSDPACVLDFASAYVEGVRGSETGMAVCIKHFPGDGVDERDQHLLASVNSLDADHWWGTFGNIYQQLINQGVRCVMAGHIYQPALSRMINSNIASESILPASLSRELLTGILREKMGFDGLIITDATPMLGFNVLMPRPDAIRKSVLAGVDMLLFTKDLAEDMGAVLDGLTSGMIPQTMVDQAVTRILSLKASMGLHNGLVQTSVSDETRALHRHWAQACASDAITLVRDREEILPINVDCTRRIRLIVVGEKDGGSFGDNEDVGLIFAERLQKEGFQVFRYDEATLENGEIFTAGISELKEKFELCIIVANIKTGSNCTTRRLEWIHLMAANAPWYCRSIPTIFVSFANPYHLFDVPYISTYINCYSNNIFCVDAVVEKLMGREPFKGVSPVDAECNQRM